MDKLWAVADAVMLPLPPTPSYSLTHSLSLSIPLPLTLPLTRSLSLPKCKHGQSQSTPGIEPPILSQSLEAQLVTSLQQRSTSTSPRRIADTGKDSSVGKSLHSIQFIAVPAAIAAVAAVVIAAQKK